MPDAAITTALIGAVPILMAQAVNIWISHRNTKKIADVDKKADTITVHVNSAATAAVAKIDALEKQVVELRNIVSEQKQVAALLAQALATKPVGPTGVVAGAVTEVKEPVKVEVVNPDHHPVPIIEKKAVK